MNSDDLGNPFEVFITIGKAGSDLQADAEGLGRMLSLQLRTTAPQNRMEMLKLIVEQLQGIGGSRSVGMGPQRVISMPDAVAGALVEHYLTQSVSQQLDLPMGNGNGNSNGNGNGSHAALPAVTVSTSSLQAVGTNGNVHSHTVGDGHVTETGYKTRADICPSCGTVSLIRIEGCEKCDVCGYSRC